MQLLCVNYRSQHTQVWPDHKPTARHYGGTRNERRTDVCQARSYHSLHCVGETALVSGQYLT